MTNEEALRKIRGLTFKTGTLGEIYEIADAALSDPAAPVQQDKPEVGWQKDLIQLLISIRPKFGDIGSRDVDVKLQQEQIDAAISLLCRCDAVAVTPKPRAVERHSDMSVLVRFDSCREASTYEGIARRLLAGEKA